MKSAPSGLLIRKLQAAETAPTGDDDAGADGNPCSAGVSGEHGHHTAAEVGAGATGRREEHALAGDRCKDGRSRGKAQAAGQREIEPGARRRALAEGEVGVHGEIHHLDRAREIGVVGVVGTVGDFARSCAGQRPARQIAIKVAVGERVVRVGPEGQHIIIATGAVPGAVEGVARQIDDGRRSAGHHPIHRRRQRAAHQDRRRVGNRVIADRRDVDGDVVAEDGSADDRVRSCESAPGARTRKLSGLVTSSGSLSPGGS